MKRIDKVIELLQSYSKEMPATASELAEKLSITRANASGDLNKLVHMGLAIKTGTKPIYFFPAKSSENSVETKNPFDLFMEKSPSLYHCGEQAKAAVLYPPNGMHILILGETGVGKSMFAEMIFDYAQAQNKMKSHSSFITFNCADYANNPQLLVGYIFGITKGAFTGATEDRPGLLEKADGGILFLDEIHRLPPEGQEMLFTFIDKGTYRRLGETNNERQAQVLLIGATTENTHSTLLQTFVRRIPMRIEIPNLVERGMDERLTLISSFFQEEAKKLSNPIDVSTNTIRALLGYSCTNNVGQLKADIQLLCAKAYAQFIAKNEAIIRITSYDLPNYIREGLYNSEERQKIWSLLPNTNSRYFLFRENQTTLLQQEKQTENDIYQIIEQKMEDMQRIGLDITHSSEVIDSTLTSYYHTYQENKELDFNNVEQIVGSEIAATANKVFEKAFRLLNYPLEESLRSGLALHLYNTIQRVKRGQQIHNPRLDKIKKEHPRLFDTALHCLSIIESDFSIHLPEDEAGFLALFFTSEKNLPAAKEMVEIIVVAHGNATASSMADVVNRLLNTHCVIGFNMPLEEKPMDTLLRLEDYLQHKTIPQDVLLLVDMGSLVNFGIELEKKLPIHIRCLELVSTLHVLEASRKASLGYSLKEIYESTKNVRGLSYYTEHTTPVEKTEKFYLLTLCTTGEGSARLLKNILQKRLPLEDERCEIVPLQMTDQKQLETSLKALEKNGKILCTVGTFQLPLAIPHFSVTEAFSEQALQSIQQLLHYELAYEGMMQNIADMLVAVDGQQLIPAIREWVETVDKELNTHLLPETKVGLICHIVCMIDRLRQGESVSVFPMMSEFLIKYQQVVSIIKQHCQLLDAVYGLTIPEDEICYITAFFLNVALI